MRMLGLVFGHTVFAITTVLAALMASLVLGASLFGRIIDRRRRPQDRLIQSYLKVGKILTELNAQETVIRHGRTRFGSPNPAEALNNLGLFYTRLGIRFSESAFFDLASDALETTLQIEPQSHPVLNNLGNVYFKLGKFDEAEEAYRRVIGLMPDSAQPHFNLGLVYERQGALDLAAREFETAIALKPDWPLPRKRLLNIRREAASAGKLDQPPAGTPPTR